MGFTDIFKGLLGGDPIAGIKGIIEEFHLSPEDKAKLQQAAQELELKRIEIEAARDAAVQQHDADMAKLQVQAITAETTSEDPYVRRARPTFLYVMIAAIGYSLIVAPVVNAFLHKGLVPMEIPGAYLELFGVSFLGYVGARTWEKTKGATSSATGN